MKSNKEYLKTISKEVLYDELINACELLATMVSEDDSSNADFVEVILNRINAPCANKLIEEWKSKRSCDNKVDFNKAFSEFDEMLKNSEPTDVLNLNLEEELIDESFLRRGRDWSEIGNKIV